MTHCCFVAYTDNISSSYDSHNDLIVTTWVDNQASDGSVASVDFSGSTATVDLSTGNYFEADLEGQSNIKTFTIQFLHMGFLVIGTWLKLIRN